MPDPERVVTIISARLYEARQKAGLTQEDAATKAGVYKNHYAQIEQGNANPTVTTLQKIADALKVDIQLLVGTKPIKK